MPYTIEMRDDEYCVYKTDADGNAEGDSLGCHDTEAAAERQITAIEVEERGERGLAYVYAPPMQFEPNGTLQRIKGLLMDDWQTGFKVVRDRYWVALWSNTFEDREKQFFPRKACDDYIKRVDMGVVPMPELWLWHTPGTRVGAAKMVTRVDCMMLAVGTFDETPAGQSAKSYYSSHRGAVGVSHGFFYDPMQFKDNAYWQFNTFEISPMPKGMEANLFTHLGSI